MTPQFDSHKPSKPPVGQKPSAHWNVRSSNSSMGAMDMLKRDRFELLSAYLDGEVTASERQQVEKWLDTDPAIQGLYQRLLKLRQNFQGMPIPVSQPVEQTVEQVFARLDRRPKRALILWGGGAVAAVLIGAFTSLISGNEGLLPQLAQSPEAEPSSAAVMIALDQPVVSIPKVAVPANPSVNPNSSGNLHQILREGREIN